MEEEANFLFVRAKMSQRENPKGGIDSTFIEAVCRIRADKSSPGILVQRVNVDFDPIKFFEKEVFVVIFSSKENKYDNISFKVIKVSDSENLAQEFVDFAKNNPKKFLDRGSTFLTCMLQKCAVIN